MLSKADSNETTDNLKVVHRSAEHLIALVNDTLDFSKIESQKLKIEQFDFMPDEIIKEVLTLHENSAQKKGIELIANNTVKELVLLGDPVRLKQILINLITNAIKFTKQGQITLTLSGEETSEQNYLLRIEVSDTGIGISKEDLPSIFDEFVQLDTDLTQKQRGAGLGLAIVKKLVLLQKGKIDVESTLGEGTRFIFQIPYKKGNANNLLDRPDIKLLVPKWFSKLHFLIVDDEEYNLYLIKNILKKWGVSFTEAHNGSEAVELAKENSYDLIFMDIRMPVMDGYEATRLILKDSPSAIILALTATAKPSDVQQIQMAGMHDFVQKPFSESALINAVIKLLPANTEDMHRKAIVNHTTIDLDELKRLSGGDSAFFDEMLSIFIRSSEEALVKIHFNFKSSNWNELSEVAHKLASPAKHIQAHTLYANLKKLENSTENNNPVELKKLIEEIENDISHINSILKQKLKDSAS
jgi:CheY-like chemotaxis protein/HPt (histidine-containing phosphotransfer) domain-containing protein